MTTQRFIDLTMDLNIAISKFSQKDSNFRPELLGHLGTHMDIMDTSGPSVDRFISKSHIVDVNNIFEREISLIDTKLDKANIMPGDSVIFKTNWSKNKLETTDYFKSHPYLAYDLIDFMLNKQVNLIGIDAPGVRRGAEHKAIDIHCANHGVFIVENLVNLDNIDLTKFSTLYCFPIKFDRNTGATCRVVISQV